MSVKYRVIILGVLVVLLAVLLSDPKQYKTGSYGTAQVGGAFTLTDTHGKLVTDKDFHGKHLLVYLGYSHCPDICPAMLSVLSDVLKKTGADADKLAVAFISLDPAHDSPQVLAEYLRSFDPRIVGLTGSEAEIKAVTKTFKAYASPAENLTPGNMLISHSGLLYLMDSQGKYIKHFESGVSTETLIAALKGQL